MPTPEILALALAMAAQPEYRGPPERREELAATILEQERRQHLPWGLLAAVVLAESGGKNLVLRRRCGGFDVGPAQIHTHGAADPLLDLETNLAEGARLLHRSRQVCHAHPLWIPCKRSRYALYNSRSPGWVLRVRQIWERLRRWHMPEA